MVLQSVGPVRHEVSVPFHDSQVRGAALLIQTGWDQYWNTEAYWKPGPFLAEHLIFRLVRSGVRVIGVDFPVGDQRHRGVRQRNFSQSGRRPFVHRFTDGQRAIVLIGVLPPQGEQLVPP